MKIVFAFFCSVIFLFSCNTSKQFSQKNIDIAKYSSQLSDSLAAKQLAGIDFSAAGANPVNWQVDLDLNKIYYFKAADGTNLSTRALGAVTHTNASTTYNSNTTNGPIQIIVYDEPCSESNSKKTTVILNNKQYTGCGKNLYDYRLNDKWILESVGNIEISKNSFPKGIPYILLSLAEKKLTGFDGCNNISSSFEVIGNSIKFNNISGTTQSCKNPAVQKIFAAKIAHNTLSYYFKDGKLFFYLIDDTILIFKKNT
jgi:heat shock protein HslJ